MNSIVRVVKNNLHHYFKVYSSTFYKCNLTNELWFLKNLLFLLGVTNIHTLTIKSWYWDFRINSKYVLAANYSIISFLLYDRLPFIRTRIVVKLSEFELLIYMSLGCYSVLFKNNCTVNIQLLSHGVSNMWHMYLWAGKETIVWSSQPVSQTYQFTATHPFSARDGSVLESKNICAI